jgi:hypothetical protein
VIVVGEQDLFHVASAQVQQKLVVAGFGSWPVEKPLERKQEDEKQNQVDEADPEASRRRGMPILSVLLGLFGRNSVLLAQWFLRLLAFVLVVL